MVKKYIKLIRGFDIYLAWFFLSANITSCNVLCCELECLLALVVVKANVVIPKVESLEPDVSSTTYAYDNSTGEYSVINGGFFFLSLSLFFRWQWNNIIWQNSTYIQFPAVMRDLMKSRIARKKKNIAYSIIENI